MPLIIVCGVPCSGKTKRTREIVAILENNLEKQKWTKIDVINDETTAVNYEDYGDFGKEKEARGKIRSAAEKLISPDTVTIIDSANYIKGFRYELWCVARAASTTCCCVVPVSNYDDCRKRNSERQEKTYTKQQFEELLLRWEEPDKNRRWESPLIPVLDEESIEENILISAITGKAPPPHRATTNPPLKSTDFLQETDEKVKAIIRQVQAAQKELGASDGGVTIKTADGEILTLSKFLTPAQLSRTRQQFKTYLRNLPSAKNSAEAAKLFLQFLSDAAN